jgi:NAD(P)-dependent dehydrogenase (short-subunit alcohol dehydrogenase family)
VTGFSGKVALVTGGGSGIGLASATELAARGAHVVVADVDAERARAAVDGLPGELDVIAADVADAGQVASMIAGIVQRLGALDLVHNNAGLTGGGPELHELTESQWDRVLDVNLKGCWLVLKHALEPMRRQGSGAIVNTASVAGRFGFRGLAAYCASKAGVIALTQVAAVENARFGIRVNAVSPGMVATPLTAGDGKGGPFPAGRQGTPQEIATAVRWLCSDEATYVNGTCLDVDGAWTATAGPRRAKKEENHDG